jgi:hypothetical protein
MRVINLRTGLACGACALLGAGGAVAGQALSSPSSSDAASNQRPAQQRAGGGPMRALRRSPHVEAVVRTRDGRWATVTIDRGVVEQVDGNRLTIREGTRTATYKTVTLEIPANARIRVNRRAAKLSDVKKGQRAVVVRGPRGTRVNARNA